MDEANKLHPMIYAVKVGKLSRNQNFVEHTVRYVQSYLNEGRIRALMVERYAGFAIQIERVSMLTELVGEPADPVERDQVRYETSAYLTDVKLRIDKVPGLKEVLNDAREAMEVMNRAYTKARNLVNGVLHEIPIISHTEVDVDLDAAIRFRSDVIVVPQVTLIAPVTVETIAKMAEEGPQALQPSKD